MHALQTENYWSNAPINFEDLTFFERRRDSRRIFGNAKFTTKQPRISCEHHQNKPA